MRNHRLLTTAALLAAVPACFAAQPAGSRSLLDFGAVGTTDDTSVFNAATQATSQAGQTLYIPALTLTLRPVFLPSNTKLYLEPGAVVMAHSGYIDTGDPVTSDKMINIRDVSGVQVIANGATFKMPKAEYTSGEYRHCLDIRGASDVYVSNINCNDSGGDGLYIGAGVAAGSPNYSRNITVEDSSFNNNRRQGFSLISGVGIYIRRCRFTNTNGTAPQAGIDIEPNDPSERLQDVHIEDSLSQGNAGDGLKISQWFLAGTPNQVGITIVRHQSVGNRNHGYEAVCQNSVPGQILIDGSSSTNDAKYGALGDQSESCAAVIFNNLTVTNPNQSRSTPQNAAVGLTRQSSAAGTMAGNVHFLSPTITDTTGSVWYYFNFQDPQGKGVDQAHFLTPVKLGGALYDPNGLLSGKQVTTVNLGAVPAFTAPPPAPQPSANGVYEAESAALSNGAAGAADCTNCSGRASVGTIGTVAFANVQAPAAGTYPVTITYVNGSTASRPGMLAVNNGPGTNIDFPVTGGWNTPADKTVQVALNAGLNRLVFNGAPGAFMADLDKIAVPGGAAPPFPSPDPTPATGYEAEAATLSGGAVSFACTGCSGKTSVGRIGRVTFGNVQAATAGTYTLAITYVNGSKTARPGLVSVNGAPALTVNFPVTGNWDTPNTTTIGISLKAGANTVVFTNSKKNTYMADLDRIDLTPQAGTSTAPAPSAAASAALYEAERAVMSNGAMTFACAGCSGGTSAGRIGTLTFGNVSVPSAGDYAVTISYVNGSTAARSGLLAVNTAPALTIDFPVTGNWDTPAKTTVIVALKAGNNTLTFSQPGSTYMADLDCIAVAAR